MKRALPLISLLLACKSEAPTTSAGDDPGHDHGGSDSGAQGEGGVEPLPQPDLLVPADADDLDDDPDVVRVQLRAATRTHTITDWPAGVAYDVDGYAYGDSLPGPTIRAKLGDTVVVEFENALDVESTIHWHGLDVPWDMDGVTWMQDPIAPGGAFTYTFVVSQVGTFWYHPHFDTGGQVDAGLYGALVVEDPAEPAVEHDLVLVLDDWTLSADDHGEGDGGDDEHAHGAHGSEGSWTVNGQVRPMLALAAGERARLRLINTSNAGYVDLSGLPLVLLAEDQGMQGPPTTPDGLLLGPGDRAELLVMGQGDASVMDAPYSVNGGAAFGDSQTLLDVRWPTVGDAGVAPDWPAVGAAPSPDPGRTDLVYVFQGDPHTETWMINGETFPNVTVQEREMGETVVIEVRNVSPALHPFHLHGNRFEVLSLDGVAPDQRTIADTVSIDTHQTMRVLLTFGNPGDWMLHCHILPHAEQGMMTVLRVVETE